MFWAVSSISPHNQSSNIRHLLSSSTTCRFDCLVLPCALRPTFNNFIKTTIYHVHLVLRAGVEGCLFALFLMPVLFILLQTALLPLGSSFSPQRHYRARATLSSTCHCDIYSGYILRRRLFSAFFVSSLCVDCTLPTFAGVTCAFVAVLPLRSISHVRILLRICAAFIPRTRALRRTSLVRFARTRAHFCCRTCAGAFARMTADIDTCNFALCAFWV